MNAKTRIKLENKRTIIASFFLIKGNVCERFIFSQYAKSAAMEVVELRLEAKAT